MVSPNDAKIDTRINVSASSNCPCRIKCIAIDVLTSFSLPSNTSELITVEGSDLNFYVRLIFRRVIRFGEPWCNWRSLYASLSGAPVFLMSLWRILP